MRYLNSLIPDIYQLVKSRGDWFTDELAQDFGRNVASRLRDHYGPRPGKPTLRLSKMGPVCPCALWHSIHHPELEEELPPWALEKYSFGHIIEAKTIMLAKAAGHEVTGEQDELVVDGIVGHRDCVIDGVLVDVKSTSTRAFGKFKDGSLAQSDTFGYLDQLDSYLVGSADDPLVTVKDTAYILAVDKQLGHMCLYEHTLRADHIRSRIADHKGVVSLPSAPKCTCGSVEDGKSVNLKLDTKASYNSYKYCCNPRLRTFLYSDGPRYLTKVVRKPDVMEVDRHGRVVYN